MKADPEDVMKHTFGWFYRLLPDERGIANCFPVTVFFQNREDGRDVIEIDDGHPAQLRDRDPARLLL